MGDPETNSSQKCPCHKPWDLSWPDPKDFARFSFVREPSWYYFAYRVLIFVYFFAWAASEWAGIPKNYGEGGQGSKYIIYLTNLHFNYLSFHNLLASIVSILYMLKEPKEMLCLHKLYWVSLPIMSVISMIIVAVYWTLLYDPGEPVDPSNVHVHGLNGLFALVDLFVSAHPWRLFHFVYPMMYGLAYGLFTVIYWAAGGKDTEEKPYVYDILDYSYDPVLAVLIFLGVLVSAAILHSLFFLLHHLRNMLVNKLCLPPSTSPSTIGTTTKTSQPKEDLKITNDESSPENPA